MDISEMTRKDFEALPHREWNEEITCNSLIILPGRAKDKHDSDYRSMDFIAVTDDGAQCLLSGCSDVIHIDGIGGFGDNWLKKYGKVPFAIPPSGWSIDCLPKSGLLRMWPSSNKMKCGLALSSFKIYALSFESKDKKASDFTVDSVSIKDENGKEWIGPGSDFKHNDWESK